MFECLTRRLGVR